VRKARRLSALAALVVAAGALTLAAAAGTAFATSPSPSATTQPLGTGLPQVTDHVPPAQSGLLWGGDNVLVYFLPGASPIDGLRCKLYINNVRQETTVPPIVSPLMRGGQVQFNLGHQVPAGKSAFRVVLYTKAGQRVDASWVFEVKAASKPGLINWSIIRDNWKYIAWGSTVTVELTVISILLALIFALLGALGRLARTESYWQAWQRFHSWGYQLEWVLRMIPYWIATFYTSLFRGTPLLLQIYVIYYAIPAFIQFGRARWGFFDSIPYPTAFASGIAALSLNYGAYLSEVFRAGIQAVPKGQTEAAWALGMKGSLTQRRIILPQAFKIVIPAVGNDFIALIKDTALTSTITVEEILRRSSIVGARYYDYLSPLLWAAVIYWILTIFFSFWQARLERRMERDRARA
jgi:polar amino acid transport system permease protein